MWFVLVIWGYLMFDVWFIVQSVFVWFMIVIYCIVCSIFFLV
nr:MAG TPA: hypothetical protein [Caudoviricetes sp.]